MTFLPVSGRDGRKLRRSYRSPLLCKHSNDGDRDGGASFPGAVFNLSTTIVGAGIMAIPVAVKVLGLLPGLAIIPLAAFITHASIDMILRAGRPPATFDKPANTVPPSYAAIVSDALGAPGGTLLQSCIILNNLGMLVVYMIIIGDVLSGTSVRGSDHHTGVLERWFGQQWWTERAFLLLTTTIFVFAPLISLKRVDSLRYTSALSVALAVVFVVVMAGIAIAKMAKGSIGMPRLLPQVSDLASFWKLFTTVPILVTAYICHFNVHPIENELKEPGQMRSIVQVSLVLCSIVYVATGLFGFLLFGEATMDDVLANFDADLGFGTAINDVVRLSYASHLMLVFPIVFYSLRLNLDGLLFPRAAVPIAYDDGRFAFITYGFMLLVFMGANLVPSIWVAFQFTGATASVAVGFVFPALIALRDVHGVATRKDRALAWAMILLAMFSSSAAIYSNICDMFIDSSSTR
ncbi:amino acid transporter AVT6B-like [Zingiber officinale]|nr:amino acid transporter AVT6B-like [Zingiber officinale]